MTQPPYDPPDHPAAPPPFHPGTPVGFDQPRRRRPRPWIFAVTGGIVAMLIAAVALGVIVRTASGQGYDDLGGGLTGFRPEPTPSSSMVSISTLPFDEAVRVINNDVQGFWQRQFEASGRTYTPARFVIFSQQVSTGCGAAAAATGPFYCSGDNTVYLDRTFFTQLSTRFKAPGDFAEAYVLAHEIGHHIQDLLGITQEVATFEQSNPDEVNAVSVRVELQADCFAGVWAAGARNNGQLEAGDLDEALKAASAVGDDTLQEQATGMVRPDQFTHGTSKQRVTWFRRGFDNGDTAKCDSLSADDLNNP